MNKAELPKGITQQEIDDAIGKYGQGKVKLASLPMDDDGIEVKNVLIKEPDLAVIAQYQQWSDKNWKKANELLIRGVVIGKDNSDKILADAGLFLAAVNACVGMIPVRNAVVKNL